MLSQVSALPFDLGIVNGDLARKTGEQANYVAFVNFFDPLADRCRPSLRSATTTIANTPAALSSGEPAK